MQRPVTFFMVLGLSILLSAGAAQSLWADARVGMSKAEVLAVVPGAALVPETARESDVFGTEWSVETREVRVLDLTGSATFGFDDAALRVAKLHFESPLTGVAGDAQCAGLLGVMTERHGAAGATERHTSLGMSFTQSTWLDGRVQVVAMCLGTAHGTRYFVGIRPLSERELSAMRAP
jgi:hypothetical protein